ncbi:BCCT family transporter [Pseudoalteromonas sp. Hal099]
MEGGVKVLSNINLICAFILLVAIISLTFSDSITAIWFTFGAYVEHMVPLSNPFGREDEDWMHAWTVFYWAWWISVVAVCRNVYSRVSRGRTRARIFIGRHWPANTIKLSVDGGIW